MLGLGLWEMLLIAALALVVVGPDRLPQALRWAGQNYAKLRRTADELRRAFVLEADRQDAEERLAALRQRQEQARAEADDAAKQHAVAESAEPADPPKDVSDEPSADDPSLHVPVSQARRFSSPAQPPAVAPPKDDV